LKETERRGKMAKPHLTVEKTEHKIVHREEKKIGLETEHMVSATRLKRRR
jgi:hypothetical protein